MRMMKAAANFFNSNAGAQIPSAVAGSAITYLLTRGGREKEVQELKHEVAESKKVNADLSRGLDDCSKKVSMHISEENRIAMRYTRCLSQRDMARSALDNSYCFIKCKLPPDDPLDMDKPVADTKANRLS